MPRSRKRYLEWRDLAVGDLVILKATPYYSDSIYHIYGFNRPLLVLEKKYKKCVRHTWEDSELHPIVVVRSLRCPEKTREFFLDQLSPPPIQSSRYPIVLASIWKAAHAKYKKPIWTSFLTVNSNPYYKPRRTSEQVKLDRERKQWRKTILKLEKEEEG